jgi:ABC-2 type transport system permease protein
MSPRNQQIRIALQTILYKEIIRFTRIWTQTLLPPAITMTLYFIIFGKLIGSQVQDIHGFTYMQFIVPGLIMMAIMTNSYANTSASFFGAKFSKGIEEILVAPVPSLIILIGYVGGGMLRGLLVGGIVLSLSALFTKIHLAHIGIVIFIAILSSYLFALAGLINAIFAKKFDDVSYIPTFILTPLTYLGGVFYSIQQLPLFFQKLSLINPILNIVDSFRYGILGKSDIHIVTGLTIVTSLCVIFTIWCWYLLEKGIGTKS